MGLKMTRKRMLQLPWPDDVPILEADDFDGYTQSLGRNRKHVGEWARLAFEGDCREQFLHVFYDVMRDNCDKRDLDRITLAQVPSTPDYTYTKAAYSTKEVAAWWIESLKRVGYDIEED